MFEKYSSKLINGVKVMLAYLLSLVFRKPIVWGMPAVLSIEPSSFCNLHCPECPVGNGLSTREKTLISVSLFEKIIEQVKYSCTYLTLYFQGEPFTHPHFTELVLLARRNGIYAASSTNAQLITPVIAEELVRYNLNKIIVSMDGITQDVYEKYRVGGSLDKVLEGIKFLVEKKALFQLKQPEIELQFLVFSHNEHQMNAVRELAKELKVDKLTFKTAQIISYEKGSDLLPKQQKYSRYVQQPDGLFVRKKKVRNICWRAFSGAVITSEGDVLPCSYDKNAEHSFGNINNMSLKEIWHGEKAKQFRQQILTDKKVFEMCRNCTV